MHSQRTFRWALPLPFPILFFYQPCSLEVKPIFPGPVVPLTVYTFPQGCRWRTRGLPLSHVCRIMYHHGIQVAVAAADGSSFSVSSRLSGHAHTPLPGPRPSFQCHSSLLIYISRTPVSSFSWCMCKTTTGRPDGLPVSCPCLNPPPQTGRPVP
ncbi:hypothetical protein LY78DRAFT_131276 [Colletotrichum sublineola]|nr:hypothetical protein LY78DRAFT_131276 [Colletotrichum sublineola]